MKMKKKIITWLIEEGLKYYLVISLIVLIVSVLLQSKILLGILLATCGFYFIILRKYSKKV